MQLKPKKLAEKNNNSAINKDGTTGTSNARDLSEKDQKIFDELQEIMSKEVRKRLPALRGIPTEASC